MPAFHLSAATCSTLRRLCAAEEARLYELADEMRKRGLHAAEDECRKEARDVGGLAVEFAIERE